MEQKFPEVSPNPGMVSVVIATYNRASLLPEAVRSCIAQTYGNVEVIIVDDGSTDGTEGVVRALATGEWAGRKISYWSTANGGPSAARQFGLERASGEFVQFLDSDDCLMPRKFELQTAGMEGGFPPADGCSSFGRQGMIGRGWLAGTRIGARSQDIRGYVRAMCSPVAFAMASCAPLWRRAFLTTGPGWPLDLKWGEDWVYFTSLLLRARRMAFIEEDLFWARDHDGSRLTNGQRGLANAGRARAFAQALQAVTAMIKSSSFYDGTCRKGLLKIARSAYLLLLESGSREDIEEFERFVREIAAGSAAQPMWTALIASRHLLGSEAVVSLARGLVKLKATVR